jgi:CRP-like cAMP-binding protein
MKKHDKDKRYIIYSQAKYLTIQTGKTLFREGDIADRMYIIVKGRIVVNKPGPVTVAILSDGDHFGELGLINQRKLEH